MIDPADMTGAREKIVFLTKRLDTPDLRALIDELFVEVLARSIKENSNTAGGRTARRFLTSMIDDVAENFAAGFRVAATAKFLSQTVTLP